MKFVGKREGAGGAITRGCVGAGVGGSDGGEWWVLNVKFMRFKMYDMSEMWNVWVVRSEMR